MENHNRNEYDNFVNTKKLINEKMNIVDKLLMEMQSYNWSSVEDVETYDSEQRIESCRDYIKLYSNKKKDCILRFDAKEIIKHANINLMRSSVLEFDVGINPTSFSCENFVALDNDPKNIKYLRTKGINAIIGTIEDLPFRPKSFDYVIAFSPSIIRLKESETCKKGNNADTVLIADYIQKIVKRAIELARIKVLIASVPIASNPPCKENIEKIALSPFYYVLYNTNTIRS